jgi:CHAT domain-containing protein
MNEERQEAYQNLIQTLLSCPVDNVAAILDANQDLIDAGLVQAIEQVATEKEEKGARYVAKFLIDIARKLAGQLGLSLSTPASSPPPASNPQLAFLLQTLQAIAISNSNPEVIYAVKANEVVSSILNANLDKLDDNFALVLRNWVSDVLPSMESLANVETLAILIGYFSGLIQQLPVGNTARNLEIAIEGYQVVLTMITYEASPELWATSQSNLATAYLCRIHGDRVENLEQAITCLNQALLVFRREAFPENWADNQINLAFAYSYRIRGERADNLEQAITCLNQALLVFTLETFPEKWADIQLNLGVAYIYRILGNKADNLQHAINCYYQALIAHTREASPESWAKLQNNLGAVYRYRILGNKADNLEESITYLNQALLVFTREDFPEAWADSQSNLGVSYIYRILGNKVDNLEQAITYLNQASLVFTREDFPEKWGRNQYHLGLAYINLSDIVSNRSKSDVRASAIRCYTEALQILPRQAFLQYYGDILFSLGLAYQKDNQLQLAYLTFVEVIDAVESLRSEIVSGDEAKQKLAEFSNEVYCRMVEVCLALDKLPEAIEYVERSKARNLVELLTDRDCYPKGATPEICDQLDQMRRAIRAEQQRLDIEKRIINSTPSSRQVMGSLERFPQEFRPFASRSFAPFIIDRTYLNKLQQQLDEFIKETIQPIDHGFTFTQKVKAIPFSDIHALTDDETAIVEWYITGNQILTFIITRHHPHPIVIPSSSEDMIALTNWDKDYRDLYQKHKNQWINNLASRLQNLAEILHIDDIISRIDDYFSQRGAKCNRLILIPHRYLHLFPLHALPIADDKWLVERFPKGVGYAPSCQLLKQSKDQELHRPHFTRLFAIQNPTRQPAKPLLGSQLEIDKIRQYFDSQHSIILKEAEATEANLYQRMEQLRSSHCLHFSCHGEFNHASPLKSALLLANPEGKLGEEETKLTLSEVFEKLYLNQCRLVTFSACETGMTDPHSISDEYIGLPSGFLYAGSLSIVSTLWSVDPIATTLLMVKFYHHLKRLPEIKTGDVAIALNKSQKWLRLLTKKKLARIKNHPKFQLQLEQAFENQKDELDLFNSLLNQAVTTKKPERQLYPFANPYYWSAFVAIGL